MTVLSKDAKKKTARHFVLGGKVALHQALDGAHRAGLDAVMLAASIAEQSNVQASKETPFRVIDLGAGVGTAGLCVAARHRNVSVTLVENDPETLALATLTLEDATNASFAERITLLNADVTLRGKQRIAAGLVPNMADHVIMNPPYWDRDKVRLSPSKTRANAHTLSDQGLEPWLRTAASILCNKGLISVIFPANGLDLILNHMRGRFGDICIFPLYKGKAEAAIRVIVTGVKGSRAPLKIAPGLVLHEAPEAGISRREWTPHANAVLNGEASLFI